MAEPTLTTSQKWSKFYWQNSFLILVVLAILLALAYPPLGADYLQPQVTATWIAVIFIFTLSGLSLKSRELKKAILNLKFNLFVQIFNLGIVSCIVYFVSRGLESINVLEIDLANGMVICSCLPMTVNMVIVLTTSSGGDEAAAVFNAACGSLLGVFATPALILLYLGESGGIEFGKVVFKLSLRVVLPIFVGQVLQYKSPTVVEFVKTRKARFKMFQEWALVYIVYCVFCNTFDSNSIDAGIGDVMLMVAIQFVMLCGIMTLAWFSLNMVFGKTPTLVVMGLYGCSHKTVAMGIPMINAIYEEDPKLGLYALPLLVWHPMQLVIGTFLAPRLKSWVEGKVDGGGDEDDTEMQTEFKETKSEEIVVGGGAVL